MIDIELSWADLLTRISRDGSLSYTELKSMDVREFFVVVTALEQQVKERQKLR